jgi:NADPH:quinone reductase-like Zn-dependent oxidoreductase
MDASVRSGQPHPSPLLRRHGVSDSLFAKKAKKMTAFDPAGAMMTAAFLDRVGGAFTVRERVRPRPAANEVLVRTAASGVNPLDVKIRAGEAAHSRHPLPAILGIDLAGVVAAVGADVSTFQVGDAVYGMTGGVGGVQGSLAEYAAVDAELLARKPATIAMREAAAIPLAFITAWEGLVDRGGIARGMRVLVHGGAGGVGHIAVQLAFAMHATVFATGSADDASFIAELGATPIDRETPVATYVAEHTAGVGFDIVYDTVGGAVLDASFLAVRRFGHVVSTLGWGTHSLAPLSFRAASYSGVFSLLPLLTGEGRTHHGAILRDATRMVEAGQLTPNVDPRRFTLATVGDAHALVRDHRNAGKVVVDV